MNSYRIMNLPPPIAAGEPVRLGDVTIDVEAIAAAALPTKVDLSGANIPNRQLFLTNLGVLEVHLVNFKSVGNTWPDAFDLAQQYLATQPGRGRIIFPMMDLPISRPFTVTQGLIDIEAQGSVIYPTYLNDHVFKFVGTYFYSGVRNANIQYTGLATSGSAIYFEDVDNCYAENVNWVNAYRGVHFNNDNRNCRVFRCGGSETVDTDFLISDGGNQHIYLGTTYQNGASTSSSSIRIEATERADLDYFTSSLHGIGLHLKPKVNGTIQNVLLNAPDLDASRNSGFVIDLTNSGGVVRKVKIVGGLIGASTNEGLTVIEGPGILGEVNLVGVTVCDNGKEGIYAKRGRWKLSGCEVVRNGNNAGQGGVRIGQNCVTASISGGSIGSSLGGPDKAARPMVLENFQLYGLVVDSGFTGTLNVSGTDITGNVTGPIQNNSTTDIFVSNCLGYRTIASGFATLSIGQSFITITPPVMGKPLNNDEVQIMLSCRSNPDLSGVETVFVGDTTAGTFDIVTSPFLVVSGQNLGIDWQICVN